MTQSLYQSTRVSFTDKVAIDKDWIVDQPSDADGQAAYADLLYALRRPEDAAARAEGALKLTPDHARAQAVLARIRASQGQADAAATLIAGAVKAAGDTDYLPSYYQAMLLLRGEGKHAPTITPDAARQARALLARVTHARAVARRCARTRRLRGPRRRRSQGGDGLRRHRLPPVAASTSTR